MGQNYWRDAPLLFVRAISETQPPFTRVTPPIQGRGMGGGLQRVGPLRSTFNMHPLPSRASADAEVAAGEEACMHSRERDLCGPLDVTTGARAPEARHNSSNDSAGILTKR